MPPPYDVFLSYNREDRLVVRNIAVSLKKTFGLRPWLDLEELPPGSRWPEGIESAIQRSRTAAVFFGPQGVGKSQKNEIDALRQGRLMRKAPIIIPVLLPRAKRSRLFEDTTWVDLREGVTDLGIAHLVWGITGQKPVPLGVRKAAGLEVNNLPYPSLNHLLKGRADELRQLEQSLTGAGQAAAILQSRAIHGLGGIGKTRLAVEYAWRSGDRYHAALFVSADSPEGLRAGLGALAGPEVLHLPHQQNQEEGEAVGAVLRWLRGHPGWLLILDNVDTEEASDAVKELLPKLAGGHVLITSRLRNWPPEIPRWPLDKIAPPEAVRFLLERTKDGRDRAADDDEQAARLGLRLLGKGLYIEAEPLMRRALEIDEAVSGPCHPDVARDLRDLAQLLNATSRLAEAEPLMRRALEIREAAFGPDHPGLTGDLHNLAWLLKDTGRLAEAEELMQRARAISEAAFGPDHPSVARDLQNLSWLLKDTGRLAEAEELMKRACAVDEAASGPDHPAVAGDLNSLAWLLKDMGRSSQAEALMRRALEIDQAAFGPNHPDFSRDLRSLAWLLKDLDRFAEAEPLMRRALEIDREVFGPEHPDVARDLDSLAWMLIDTGRVAEAQILRQQALDILKKALGAKHPTTKILRKNLRDFRPTPPGDSPVA